MAKENPIKNIAVDLWRKAARSAQHISEGKIKNGHIIVIGAMLFLVVVGFFNPSIFKGIFSITGTQTQQQLQSMGLQFTTQWQMVCFPNQAAAVGNVNPVICGNTPQTYCQPGAIGYSQGNGFNICSYGSGNDAVSCDKRMTDLINAGIGGYSPCLLQQLCYGVVNACGGGSTTPSITPTSTIPPIYSQPTTTIPQPNFLSGLSISAIQPIQIVAIAILLLGIGYLVLIPKRK